MRRWLALLLSAQLVGCGSTPEPARAPQFRLEAAPLANEILLFSLSLLDTGYRFGGRNPEAGLDCSGMVSYVVEQVSGRRLPHNASQIAALTQPVERDRLRAADLVFFNTSGKRYSHMGIYIGDGRFIHAPSSNGRVRIERLDSSYFASRYDGARSLF